MTIAYNSQGAIQAWAKKSGFLRPMWFPGTQAASHGRRRRLDGEGNYSPIYGSINQRTCLMTTKGYPIFLTYIPCELRFGTSGLRGLVREMTDLEVYVKTRCFLHNLHQIGDVDPIDLSRGLQHWRADARQDPGRGTNYTEPQLGNPDSFAAKFQQMRQRQVPPDEIERDIDARFRQPIRRQLS